MHRVWFGDNLISAELIELLTSELFKIKDFNF